MNYIEPLKDVIVLDVDGVILDFDKSFSIVAGRIFNNNREPLKQFSNSYNMNKRYNLSKEDVALVWKELEIEDNDGWDSMPLVTGADIAFKNLQSYGFKIHLITGIDDKFKEKRLCNLSKYGLTPDKIVCVGVGAPKIHELINSKPISFVDDRLQFLHEANIVPNRIWIDRNDEQNGYILHEDIVYAKSLLSWSIGFINNLENDISFISNNPKKYIHK